MKSAYRILTALVLSVFLFSCGGGDDEVPCPPNTPCDLLVQPVPGSNLGVSLALTDANGAAIQTITAVVPGTLTAKVTGTDIPVIVTFSSSIGDLPIKTAVTDGSGNASVNILAGNTFGAGTVTAKLASGENTQLVFVVGATDVQMGSGVPFVAGAASVSTPQLSAGGTASVSVIIKDGDGNPFTEAVDVNFSSTCSKAAVPKATFDSPVTLINGTATSTYLAKGCAGDDPITVTANAGGKNLAATASINVLPASAGSIVFVSATPEQLGLKGSGLVETSIVVFQVFDITGMPVANKTVNFALTTEIGGITLSVAQAISNAQGLVQTVVNAGTVPTTVRVTATMGSNPVITSQSSQLVLSTSITLALTDVAGNPIQSITSITPGTLVANVSGAEQPVIVTFSSSIGNLPIKTAVTDDDGNASVKIFADNTQGAGTVTASLVTGEKASLVFTVGASGLQMGSGVPFVAGQALVGAAQISAGGTASVSVVLVDGDSNPFTEAVDVNFSSTCSKSSVPKAMFDTPVTLINGNATSTYQAKGCVGDDPITVTANAGGQSLTATASINVLPASVGSIVFVSATPELIGLKGTGLVETSTVVFKVFDITGLPAANKTVNFALNTEMGGTFLSVDQVISDAQGLVQTVVNAGTTSTAVRVTASIGTFPEPIITSESSRLVLSTGIPDQDSFTVAAEVLNPEGWSYDNEQVQIIARLADAFNNPPPDGTAVYFTTEGGSIDASCLTVSGGCSVTWYSQNPRPTDGRITITATAIGEETFADTNGNGRLDESEMPLFLSVDVAGRANDLDEAFTDYNEDGAFTPAALEELIDFNNNGIWDARDGLYNGVLCSIPAHAGCATAVGQPWSVNIRENFVMIMAGSQGFASNIIVLDSSANNGDGVLDLYGEEAGQVTLRIADLNNQQMPAGTKVKFSSSVGEIISEDTYIWPSSNVPGGLVFGVVVKGEDIPKNGTLFIETETPKGVVTQLATVPIVIH
jgi:hypothetical protein